METCWYCGKQDTKNPCNECHPSDWDPSGLEFQTPTIIQKVFLRDYGHESVKRIEEMKRRVILPDTPTDGRSYYVGRRGENGKIQEREPNY